MCAHAGLKTGEDGPTHADPQALQLLQENFPPGVMITLTPWDPQELYPLVLAALQKRLQKDTVATLQTVLAALRSKDSAVPICNPHTFACTVMLLGPQPELRVSAGGADRNKLAVFRFRR